MWKRGGEKGFPPPNRLLLADFCQFRQAEIGQKREFDFAIHQSPERAKLPALQFLSKAGS